MYFADIVALFDKERQEHNIFHDLMTYRVHEILLVASLYDSFILESDGSLFEQIYGEYYKLNLTSAPRVTSAYTYDSAVDLLSAKKYDLVIIMASIDVDGPIELAKKIKKSHVDLPILLLAMNNSILGKMNESCAIDNTLINRVFVWNGYSKLFVAMVKYIEDLYNVDNDTQVGLVRVILLVEDSIRYYSRYLPILYSVIMRQTQLLIEEESQLESYKILRMRGRPKVLLATSFEEAMDILNKYEPKKENLISILHEIQDNNPKQFIGEEELKKVSSFLNLTMSEIYGVVTYYSMLSTVPRGKYLIRLCNSPVCNIVGSDKIASKIKEAGYAVEDAEVVMIPNTTIALSPADFEKFNRFLDIIDDHDDVQRIFHNGIQS